MSFALLRRQQSRIQEVAQSGTYDSVLEAVETAAAARAFTDEGTKYNRGAKNKQRVMMSGEGENNNNNAEDIDASLKVKTAEDEMLMQHHGSISMNESVARKVANARMAGDARKNIQDNQRRFLHSRMKPQHLKHVKAAQQEAKHLMRRKNESGDPLSLKKKKSVTASQKKKGKKAF